MTKSRKNPRVDAYLRQLKTWREETGRLREIILDCGLNEELKWGKPCYTYLESNVVIIQGFKASCSLMFFNGALLKDPKGVLVKPGENSQAARVIRFTNVREIDAMERTVKGYIQEAVGAEKAGLKVEFNASAQLAFPEEFQRKLGENPALRKAFDSLTPGRRRAYTLYFSAAKQSKTRESRIEKCTPHILAGKGFNER